VLAAADAPPVTEPIVSIIIPCYNSARWIAATLDSALAQTWPQKEIVLINDGSTDDSLAIARRFESRHVRIIDQPNRGAAAARNAGVRASRGEYVQFLDADDLLAPDKIAQQMPILQARGPGTIASGAWARFQTDPLEAKFVSYPNWRNLTGVEFLQIHYETGSMMHPAAWLASRSLLERAGPWNESLTLNDDGEYFGRVILAAAGIVFCPEARAYYRSGLEASLSGRTDRRALTSLYGSVALTVDHLLAADASARTRAAAAYAWKWTAFELYPGAPDLSRAAEERSRALGGSTRPFPAGGRFQLASRLLGWRLAKRLRARGPSK
jgi:glycosyltransferase involved in cell wall biosynthesis